MDQPTRAALARPHESDPDPTTALHRELAALKTIFDTIPDYIFVKDANGRFLMANRAWLQARGRSADEVIGRSTFDLYAPSVATRMHEQDQAVMRSGIPQMDREQLVLVPHRDGTQQRRWVSTSKIPLRDGRGNVVGVVGISRDITDRRHMERERAMEHAIVRVLAEASGLDAAMERLIATICESMGWAYGAHWVENRDGTRRRAHFWSSVPLALKPEDEHLWTRAERGVRGPLIGKAWREAKPTWVGDIADSQAFRRKASCHWLSFRSAYAFPILAGQEVIGVLEFFGHDVREPDDLFVDATRAIGTQIGDFIRRKQAEEGLLDSEEQLRAMFENATIGIAMTGLDMRYLRVNRQFAEIIGYSQQELSHMLVTDVNVEENIDDLVARRAALLNGAAPAIREKPLIRKDGALIWVAMVTSVIRGKDGAPRYFLTIVQDISERRRAVEALQESEEQFRQLAGNIPQVFWICDADEKTPVYVSAACEKVLGARPEVLMKSPRAFIRAVHRDDRRRVYEARRNALTGNYNETYRVLHPDGTVRWVQDRAFPVRNIDGEIYRIAGIIEDVTDRKRAEERLLHLAHFDVLTNLPNRALFYDRLGHAVAHANRDSKPVGVLFVDVDRFKYVNDTMGHDAGDVLLRQIARRLGESVRSDDTVGRLGGDEFAIVLNSLTAEEDAGVVARKIINTLREPFIVNGTELLISGSIGITLFPHDSSAPDELIRNADTAMYRAKEMGRNTFQFYRPEMNVQLLETMSIETQLRRALERSEFTVYYQPKVDVSTRSIIGAEALIHWQHPERGDLSASHFIPVLEESGIVVQVGEWVFREVCRQLREWKAAGLRVLPVAVNLSARQFLAPDLGPFIERTLAEHDIDPAMIELEITESSIMRNTDEALRTLNYLSELGMGVSIDDFGTGYSSLAYLKRFPIKALKIDRSFVRDITTDADDATITRTIISMAHSLDIKVIAEGVETDAQLAFLSQYGCDEVQGYLFSRPVPAVKFAEGLTR